MDECKAWLFAAYGVFILVAILVGYATVLSIKEDNRIKEMVESGARPLAASCAIRSKFQICTAAGMIELENK